MIILALGGFIFAVIINLANGTSTTPELVESIDLTPAVTQSRTEILNSLVETPQETAPTLKMESVPIIPKESLIIVDSQHPLTEEFINTEIVPNLITIREKYPQIPVINENTQILAICGDGLNSMIMAAKSEGIEITVRSAFRSYYQQQVAYDQATDKTAVNLPGESQHHTGLAIDFTSPEVGNVVGIYTGFGQSLAGLWLANNAYQYGFVLSYTNNHDGMLNEEWHYFYIGKDLALIWHDSRLAGDNVDLFTLQEQYSALP